MNRNEKDRESSDKQAGRKNGELMFKKNASRSKSSGTDERGGAESKNNSGKTYRFTGKDK